ncbi:phage major capsid protein [Sphingomonas bisphenolicum]
MPDLTVPPLAGSGSEGARKVNVPFGERFAASSSFNAATRTLEIVAATETPVKMRGWTIGLDCEWYYEVLDCRAEAVDLTDVQAGNCPLLDAHQRYSMAQRAGSVTAARFETGKVIVTGALGQNDLAKAIEAELGPDATAPLKVSAGYRREQMMFERFEGDIPVYRVTRWAMREVSFVPIAADPNAGVRSGDHVSPCTIMENRTMPEVNTAAGAAPQIIPPVQEGQRQEVPTIVTPPIASPDGAQEGQRAPTSTISRFSAGTALAFVEQARAFGDTIVTRANELVAQNERGEVSIETARSQLMQAAAEAQRAQTGSITTGGGNVQVTTDAADKWQRGAMASIIERAGLTEMVTRAAKMRGETIDLNPGELRGIRNVELARMSLENAGVRIQSYDRDEIVSMALTHRSAGGPFQSSSAFGVLLENVMHKTLQAAYITAPDTWRRFCGIGSVSDFRPHPRILRGTFGALDALTENGEFKNKAIPDGAKESISAGTKGNIVGLTRQAIVNDDLGAFNDITVELGRAAKLSVEKDVYILLSLNGGLGPVMGDGKTLFHADHVNIAAGAVPSVDAFDALSVLMGSQMDLSGNEYLDITPDVFLGPLGMKGKVVVINGAEYDPDTAGKLQMPNRVKGLFRDIIGTPRLPGTRYYAFADPNVAPAIEVVFLNGNQEPYTEMKEGWRIDGTEWKVRFDYGVGALNWRSAATSAGA